MIHHIRPLCFNPCIQSTPHTRPITPSIPSNPHHILAHLPSSEGPFSRTVPSGKPAGFGIVGDDGEGPYIREWMTPLPKPSDHQIQEALVLHHEEFAAGRYREKRKGSYPSITDQLDALFWARQGDHTLIEELDERIRMVKREFPKLGGCDQD